jgi:hypothetical protein
VVDDLTGTVTDTVESVTKPLTGSTPAPTTPARPTPTPTPTPTCLVLGVVKVGDVCL